MICKQLLKSKENTTRIWPKELLLRFPVDASFSARFPLAVSFPAVNAYCRSPAHVACCKFSRAYCLFQVPALASGSRACLRFPRMPQVPALASGSRACLLTKVSPTLTACCRFPPLAACCKFPALTACCKFPCACI